MISLSGPGPNGADPAEPTAKGTRSTRPLRWVLVLVATVGLVGLIAWWHVGGLIFLAHLLVIMVLLSTLTVFIVANNGRSAWYLGVMLLVVYATFAMTLYLLPPAV